MIPRSFVVLLVVANILLPFPCLSGKEGGRASMAPGTEPSIRSEDEGCLVPLEGLGRLEGHFIENLGQLDNEEVRFYAMGDPLSVGLTPTGLILTMSERADVCTSPEDARHTGMTMFRLNFLGCNPVEPIPGSPPMHPTNYFIGNDPARWVRGARTYSEVCYDDLYRDVDLRLRFLQGMLKYEFIVGESGTPGSIRLAYEGVDDVRVEEATGDMLVRTPYGTVRDSRPVITSTREEGETHIVAGFERPERGAFGFKVPCELLDHRPFVIDPGLRFSTYLGRAKNDDMPMSASVDSEGNIIVGGYTDSDDFPTTTGVYDREWGTYKAFLVKFDPTLSTMLFSTFYGGSNTTALYATFDYSIDVLGGDRILVVGHTAVSDFPVTGDAFEKSYHGQSDGYILVLAGDGGSLLYSSYFGGELMDWNFSISLLQDGSLLMMGETASTDLPTTSGVYQPAKSRGIDVFLAKFDSSLRRLVFCTYIGGSLDDRCCSGGTVGCDLNGDIYMVGVTSSTDFPTTADAYRTTPQGDPPEVFFVKLNRDASQLLYGTYIGGNGEDYPIWLHVTQLGQAYVLGYTSSIDFPVTSNAADGALNGSWDGFILALDQYGYPRYCTLFGGEGDDRILRACFDPEKELILFAGETTSTDLPCTEGCYCPIYGIGSNDLFVAAISRISYTLRYCTYIGSNGTEYYEGSQIRRLVLNREGEVLMSAYTKSTNFPTTQGAYQRNGCGLNYDGLIFVLGPTPVPLPGAPTGFEVTAGDGRVRLVWDRHVNESYVTIGYAISRGLTPDQLVPIANVTGNLSYEDTHVVNGKRYYYELRVINSMGAGDPAGPLEVRPIGALSEPRNFNASTGNGTIILAWDTPESMGGVEVLGYHVLRGPTNISLAHLGTVLSRMDYTDASVVPGVSYWYSVVAYNERGNGTVCTPIHLMALDKASPPTGLEAVAGNGWVKLTWGPPESTGGAPILGYMVYRGPSREGMAPIGSVSPMDLGHNDTAVEGGQVYFYYVVAMTVAGEGRPTDATVARPTGVPGPPQDLDLEAGDRQVRLSWSGPSTDRGMPVTGYRVYLGPLPGALVQVESLGDVREHLRRELDNGVTYYFSVSAVNANGEGPRCEVLSAVPLGVPEAPSNLTATAAVDRVTLRWAPPEDTGASPFLDYVLLRGASKDTLVPLSASPLRDALEYEDTDVELGATYFYSVMAVNPYGAEGPRTDCEEVVVAVPPGSVMGLAVLAGDGWVNLTWSPPADTGGLPVTGYIVLKRTAQGDLVEVAYPMEAHLLDVFVDNGVTYHYAVRAVSRAGAGPYEVVVNATPWGAAPPPERLSVGLKDGKVVVRWAPPSGPCVPITGYILMRGTSPDSMSIVAELGEATEYVDSDVEPGRVYYYSVRARTSSGDGTDAGPASIRVPKDVGPLKLAVMAIGVVLMVLVLFLIVGWQRARTTGADEVHEGEHQGEQPVDDQGPPGDATDADSASKGTNDGEGR